MLIDTHAHLDFKDFDENLNDILQKMKSSGVEKVVIPAVEPENFEKIIKIISENKNLYGAIGIHPSEAKKWNDFSTEKIKTFAQNPKVVAIGEIGLDYYWDKSFNNIQKEVFIKQIEIAKEIKKPVIIHDREAHADTIKILKETNAKEVGVIMHCFSGSPEFAMECIKEGFYIAMGGVVTFKNAKKPQEVAKAVPLENLLLETDSPFLAPEPYRGKTNSPDKIIYIAEKIASLKGLPCKEIQDITTKNAKTLFNL